MIKGKRTMKENVQGKKCFFLRGNYCHGEDFFLNVIFPEISRSSTFSFNRLTNFH